MTGLAAPPSSAARAFAWTGGVLFVLSLNYFLYVYGRAFGEGVPDGPRAAPALFNAGLFTAFALHHSLFARTRLKGWVAVRVGPRLERSVYVWIASLLFLAVCAAWRPVPGLVWQAAGAATHVLYALQVAGIWLTVRAAAAIDILELAGIRQASGAEPAATHFRTDGVYGRMRHPIYTAWFLVVFAAPTMTATKLVFAVVSSAYLLIAIPFEERSLAAASPAYREYCARVRWKLVPGLY